MKKKVTLFAGAVLCLFVTNWGYYQYQKPRADAAQAAAVFHLTAEQLYAAYSKDETSAGKKYNDKVIAVTGVVTDVQTNARSTAVLLGGGTANGGVNCSFQKVQNKNIAAGTHITVKGRCTGFLMDVTLTDAVLVTN